MSDPNRPETPAYDSSDVTAVGVDYSGTTGATVTGQTSGTDQASGTADVAKEQASHVKDASVDAGKQVAGTAKDQVKNVASEAKSQAKDLLGQTRSELSDQAATQQKRVASGLGSLSDELHQMADRSDGDGVASDLVKQAATRAGDVASWLGDRDPGSLLDDVSRFARQRPGTFIAIAAAAGLIAGRLTSSLVGKAKDDHHAADDSARPPQSDRSSSGAHLAPATVYPPTTPVDDYGVTSDVHDEFGAVSGDRLAADPLANDGLLSDGLVGDAPLDGDLPDGYRSAGRP